jgi:hypothetical protein
VISEPVVPCHLRRIVASPLACGFAVSLGAAALAMVLTGIAQRVDRRRQVNRSYEAFVADAFGARTVSVDFNKQPLSEVFAGIIREGGLPLEIDWASLAPLYLTPDLVTVARMQNVQLEIAFRVAAARSSVDAGPMMWARAEDGKTLRLVSMYDPRFFVVHRYWIGDLVARHVDGGAGFVREFDRRHKFVEDATLSRNTYFERGEIVVKHSLRGHDCVQDFIDDSREPRFYEASWLVPALHDKRK